MLKLLLAILVLQVAESFAQVTITRPALTIESCVTPSSYLAMGNIVIRENNKADFSTGTNLTLVFSLPANFEFTDSTL